MAPPDPRPESEPPALRRWTGRDLAWRCSGFLAFGMAAGAASLHRAVLAVTVNGPPSAWEMVLGLLSFAFASLGLLLLLHGAQLFADPRVNRRVGFRPECAERSDVEGREAVARALAERAIAAAQSRHQASALTLQDDARRKERACPLSHPTSISTDTGYPL